MIRLRFAVPRPGCGLAISRPSSAAIDARRPRSSPETNQRTGKGRRTPADSPQDRKQPSGTNYTVPSDVAWLTLLQLWQSLCGMPLLTIVPPMPSAERRFQPFIDFVRRSGWETEFVPLQWTGRQPNFDSRALFPQVDAQTAGKVVLGFSLGALYARRRQRGRTDASARHRRARLLPASNLHRRPGRRA